MPIKSGIKCGIKWGLFPLASWRFISCVRLAGGNVRQSCAASIHRGDRGLHSAFEANGEPELSLALSLSTKCGDKVW